MATRSAILVLLLVPLLAGCATEPAAPAPDDAAPAQPPAEALTPETGERLFDQALMEMPPRIGIDMKATRGSEEILALRGFHDDHLDITHFLMRADPIALGAEDADQMGPLVDAFRRGVEVYAGPEGGVYIMDGTALVFPADSKGNGFVPSPRESPFMGFFDDARPQKDDEGDVTVKSVKPVTHRGQPAIEMEMTQTDENGTSEGVVVLFTSPPRPARIDLRMPQDHKDETFAGAHIVMDLYYDDEIPTAGPANVMRTLGLSYTSRVEGASSWFDAPEGRTVNTTWTFTTRGGIPLDEVEVVVKGPAPDDDMAGLHQMPDLWTMRLSEGSREVDGVSIAFTDADGDGLVSPGDTLLVRVPNGEGTAPTIVLRDLQTGTYVVPGPGPFLALAGVGLAALALRRR